MISIASLYCRYDTDHSNDGSYKIEYTIVGSSTEYHRDIEPSEDVLSIKDFDYSHLDDLIVISDEYVYTVDVSKLLKLPLTKLRIDTKTNYINGSVDDILKGMKSVNNLAICGFDGSLDLSGFKNANTINIWNSRLTDLTLSRTYYIDLSLNQCIMDNHNLIPSLYNDSLMSEAKHIEKFTIYQCRQTPRECIIVDSN